MSTKNKIKVLLVDDSIFMLKVVRDMLGGTEFEEISVAQDGYEAMEKYEKIKPNIVLLDIVLPGESGEEVLDRILDFDPEAKIIMLSSLGTEEMVAECLKRGAKYFLQKPFEQDHLLRELRELIGRRVEEYKTPPTVAVDLSFTGISIGMKFFGQYLLEKGRITKEQLLQALEYQKKVNVPLETMCIEKGLLNATDLLKIREHQKKNLDKDIGDIMVEERIIDSEMLQNLRRKQKENWIYLGEALVRTGGLTLEALVHELDNYKEEQEKEEWEITKGLEKVQNKLIVKAFIDFTIKIFQKILAQQVKVKICLPNCRDFALRDYTIEQKTKGTLHLAFLANLSETIFFHIASVMFNKEVKTVQEEVIDAVKEFLNIIDGNSCSKLSTVGMNLTTLPPVFYNNKSEQKYTFQENEEFIFVSLVSTIGDFDILVRTTTS